MNQACVSLEEVFAAAAARAASLVPETSGYLALAVADATSRLPYVHDDRAVLLTVDGGVMVPRKGALTASADAARVLRDVLRRLLATSSGSMPGLAAAARERSELDVERVVADIEAALIPVNRAAAKRALARLARETLRAKEAGKLKKRAAPVAVASPSSQQPSGPASTNTILGLGPPPAVAPQQSSAALPAASPLPAPEVAAPAHQAAAPPAEIVALPHQAAAPPAEIVALPHHEAPPPAMFVAPPALVVAPPAFVVAPPALVVAPPLVVVPPPPPAEMPTALDALATPTPFEVDVEISATPAGYYEAQSDADPMPEGDATIADPSFMAVHETAYEPSAEEAATQFEAAVAEKQDAVAPDASDSGAPAHTAAADSGAPAHTAAAEAAADEEDDALTRPWRGGALEVAVAEPMSAARAHDTPSTSAPHATMFVEPVGTRADELLDAFRAQDQGDASVLAAAGSLRAYAGLEESSQAHPPPTRVQLWSVPQPRRAPALPDVDDDLPMPPPRLRDARRSHWPLAIFALGLLALFAAWLYRPTLAHDFFGLRRFVAPASAPPQAAPPSLPDSAAPEPAAPAIPARNRDARASDGAAFGTHRRRD